MPKQLWLPDLIYTAGGFRPGTLVCDEAGQITQATEEVEAVHVNLLNNRVNRLNNRAVLPGLVNAHSHAFQRVIRGRTEYRTANNTDSFWTWREMMYSAASRLSPEDVYDASRMAFMEMALTGITTVGEFHYLHHGPDGSRYDDPNLLAKEVVRAANDVGLRIALLRVAYARSGHETEPNPQQRRFIEAEPEEFLKNLERLGNDLNQGGSPTVSEGSLNSTEFNTKAAGALPDRRTPRVLPAREPWGRASASAWLGIAPHSVRAVPLSYLKEIIPFANERQLPVHMHLAEQPAEVSACIAEYGRSPVALLATEGLLSERFTGVHAIHVSPKAVGMLADARAMVCACPTTERNLGDGIVPAENFFKHDVRISLGTDSHTQIDLLEDARELEYHLRLQKMERVVLEPGRSPTAGFPAGQPGWGRTVREGSLGSDSGENLNKLDGALPDGQASAPMASALAARLFECATINGAQSIGAFSGTLDEGSPADFFTVDLDDPSIAGASSDDLLSAIVFSLSRTAVKEVVVGGKRIVENGRHAQQEEIVEKFKLLQKKLWG
jgi:formimidoylglutamate deiminase